MSRVEELQARRDSLLVRSASLRRRLQDDGDALDHSLSKVERGVSVVRKLTGRPAVLAAGAGLLLLLGPRKAMSWISRGLLVTSLARRAYGLFAAHRSAHQPADLGTQPRLPY